jgi:isopenicillin N synthase-like dioxygenase
MGNPRIVEPTAEAEAAAQQAFDANLLHQLRTSSHINLRAHAPAVRKLHIEQGRFFHQPDETKSAYAMPPECKTGVAGTAEYGNQGFSLMDGEKESVRFRKNVDGGAVPSFPDAAAVGTVGGAAAAWQPRQFEAAVMEAHDQLEALGRRVLDGIEGALRAEANRDPAPGVLSKLLDYEAVDPTDLPGGAEGKREAERSNVTIGITRYMRKGEAVETRPDDPGEVNKSFQRKGEGLPVGAHTDASILTMVVSPSQLGAENGIFFGVFPMFVPSLSWQNVRFYI